MIREVCGPALVRGSNVWAKGGINLHTIPPRKHENGEKLTEQMICWQKWYVRRKLKRLYLSQV